MGDFINFLGNNLADFWTYTGFANATTGHIVMILVGLGFIYLAVAKEFEPMLLIPIGFGILIGRRFSFEYIVSRSDIRMVSAAYFLRHWGYDGLLRTHL